MDTSDPSSPNDVQPQSAPASPGRRPWLSPAAMMVLVTVVLLAGTAAWLHFFVARRIPELTVADFDAAQERWAEHGPASYDMDIVIEGARPGEVHIEVRDHVATHMSRDGRVPSQPRTWETWTVPGQFETIERELELASDPVGEMQAEEGTRLFLRAEFDQQLGFVRRFHRAVLGGGPEVYWEVTRFTPQQGDAQGP